MALARPSRPPPADARPPPRPSSYEMAPPVSRGSRPLLPDAARRPPSPPEARCMSELHHDRLLADRETIRHTVPTQRTGDAHPSGTTTTEQPRLAEVADPTDLTGQAQATAAG